MRCSAALLALLALFLWAGCAEALVGEVGGGSVDAEALKVVYNANLDKAVLIVLHGVEYGTGWWVAPGTVVTAAHVVGYDPQAEVVLVKGEWRGFGRVVYVDKEKDVAVIRVDGEPGDAIYLKVCDGLVKGQQIIVVGYPLEVLQLTGSVEAASVSPRAAFGEISWVDPTRPWLAEIHVTVDAGNSGGPVVDADKLCVVGIVSFALPGKVANMYYITGVDALVQALRQAGVEFQVEHVDGWQQEGYTPSNLPPPPRGDRQLLVLAAVAAAVSAVTAAAIALCLRGGGRW